MKAALESSAQHMELKDLKLTGKHRFLHHYDATYENSEGHTKVYEVISRDPELTVFKFKEHALERDSEGVGMIMFNKERDKILLEKEWRMACGTFLYNFPGGLIDHGETPEEASKRELKEETGLNLVQIDKVLSASFTAVGFCNETVTTVIGVAEGEIQPSDSVDEEIETGWYTKEEVRELLNNNEPMALRTQSVLYFWSAM